MKCSTCYRCSSQDKSLQPVETLVLVPRPTPALEAVPHPPLPLRPVQKSPWRCPNNSTDPEIEFVLYNLLILFQNSGDCND